MPKSQKSPSKIPSPFCLRLTPEEKRHLQYLAGNQPLGAYIRETLLNDPQARRPKKHKPEPVKDYEILAHLLAKLGQSRLANNLNQLAYAANSGSLDMQPETVQELEMACAEIKAMRKDILSALGLRP